MGVTLSKLLNPRRSNTKMTTAKTKTIHPVFGVERNIEIPCKTYPKVIFPTADEIEELESRMPGCQHGWFPSAFDAETQLHYRQWVPEGNKSKPKAIMVWAHGIADHSGVNFITQSGRRLGMSLLSAELMKENIALYTFDMYGHGYSEGTRAFIPATWDKTNLQDYINFVKTIVATDIPDIPIFLSGESYGGCLTIHTGRYFQDNTDTEPVAKRINSLLLHAPAIIGDLPPAPVVFVLRYVLAPMYPQWIPFFMPNPISPDRIWSDPEIQHHNALTGRYMNMGIDMSGRPFRLGTAVNLLSALEQVRTKAIPGLTIPFLCQHGTSDYGVPISGSELLWQKSATPDEDKVFYRHNGAYHDLLSEPVAEQVVTNIITWINTRLTKL